MTVLAELDGRTHKAVLQAVADGAQLPAVADRLGQDIRVVRALASEAGFPDRDAVRVALARLAGPPKPRRAPEPEPEPDHPIVAVATAFHGTHPAARTVFLADLGDRAQLEALTVCLAAMLPPRARLSELTPQAVTLQLAVRSRNVQHIRDVLDAHDPLALCDIAANIVAALPAVLDPADALAWCDRD